MNKRDDDLMRGRNDAMPAPSAADTTEVVRRRQRERARLMAILLGVFVVLVFAISIVKMQIGHAG
ncbi:MAG: hypothetical protein J7500_03880 [Sphingomonas sp.]|uniref:hypothetical protein n=1 Tax=Sphingomonas sp. TaxID=28214 RepID=UPI001AFE7EB8|nr:hypothetical protein [Sphingomonas sp.]MBO9621831.1 hypothetical protein [Sphingomonas sp.]